MSKLPYKIQIVQDELNKLSTLKNFDQARKVVLSIVSLLDDQVDINNLNSFKLFNDDNGKIRANATWFYEDPIIADRKATYTINGNNQLNIDFKLYGLVKLGKQRVSWITGVTSNFEDEQFNTKQMIGIDFVIPKTFDRIVVVLTNNYVIRTLELKEDITSTYQEILSKWMEIKDFSNKSAVHTTLWESFDLHPLNKKFYTGISERFITLRRHLIKENIFDEKHSSMFANRLIGRVIFTWFLDKKGIINSDQKYFDSKSFSDDNDYYKNKLEILFFNVLNTPISERDKKGEGQTTLFGKDKNSTLSSVDDTTPFLNGGLFEARENDLYKDNNLSFPKNYFDDLFDFLSGYNFTTDESTSQFQQVAIDPEMLGRIFENLLAEITEETGEQARKAKGAFYTPREIVDYMCKESLKEYLKTKLSDDTYRDQRLYQLIDAPDKDFQDQDHNWRRDWKPYKEAIISALDNLKVLDPACGSGAFPIGMLQLLVRVYERLEPRFDGYKAKLQIIEKNIYGVDIEPMAVEIARLRTWLSIIVDEESDSRKIKPLPNLDFKFVCANSLIDFDKSGESAFGDDPELENKLKDIRDAYFNTQSIGKKKKLKLDYEKLVNVGESFFGTSEKSKQLKTYRPFDNESSASFFNSDFMFGVETYDIVIGNPPYIKEYTSKNAFNGLRESPYYQGKMDLWYLFSCRFIDLIKENGIECFIAQNNWVTSSGASKMRNKVITDTQIISLIDFGDYKIFETAGIQTMVMLFKKSSVNEKYNFDYRSIISDKPIFTDVVSVLNKIASDNVVILTPEINRIDLIDKKLLFNASNLDYILEKIKKKANFVLDAKKEVAQGIVYPQDKLNKTNKNILGDDYKVGEGVFVLNNQEKDSIHLTDKELALIKPSYTTKELIKWYGNKNNQEWTIYTDSSFKNPQKIESYLNIKNHLDKFTTIISSDNQPYGLHRARDEKFFKGNKIVVARKSSIPTFTYTDFDSYVSATFNVIKTDRTNLKYLTAILNSKVVSFWLKYKGKMQGNNYQIDKEPILEIPIFVCNEGEQKEIIKLVDDIISAKKNDARVVVKNIEDQIDDLVMDLYGLNDEEKEVIRNSIK